MEVTGVSSSNYRGHCFNSSGESALWWWWAISHSDLHLDQRRLTSHHSRGCRSSVTGPVRRMQFHVVLNLRKIIRQCSRRIVTEWGLINIIFCFTICWFQFWKFRSRQSYVYCFHSVVGKYHLNRQGRTIHLTMALTELYPWRHLETEKIGIYYLFKVVYSIRKLTMAERE